MDRKKLLLFIVGFVVLIVGISLVLVWWQEVVSLFKGLIGMVLAVAGLLTLYFMEKK